MIPKLFKSGKSFKGLVRYLSTDPKANTSQRVPWTQTRNCAYDDVPSALDEMIWTYRSADWLKRQAGIGTGGSQLKDPVRHFSLNWHPSEQPSREHMIETVDQFLKFMRWDEHQAILFPHTDKHPHVHVVINAVHPETGRSLDARFDRARAQRWALAYEREHGLVCEQRLLPEEERQPAPTREAWLKLKEAERQFAQAEAEREAPHRDYFERHGEPGWKAKEWDLLRGYQKEQREQHFAEGKEAFRETRQEIFREVRAEFRHEWRAFYQARRDGMDADRLAEVKADILSRQNGQLESRRDEACGVLREHRDETYQLLLSGQQQQRAELKGRQQQDLRSFHLLDRIYDPDEALHADRAEHHGKMFAELDRHATDPFDAASREVCEPGRESSPQKKDEEVEREPDEGHQPGNEHHRVRDPASSIGGLGLGALGVIAKVGERLFDDFFGDTGHKRPQPKPEADEPRKPRAQNDNTARAAERQLRADERQAEEAARLEAYWQERRRNRGHRDRD